MTTPPDDAGLDPSPGADLADAAGWLLLGAAVVVASFGVDRLQDQDVPPFAAPGLLPGLLGIALLLMGGVLLTRSLRRRATTTLVAAREPWGRAALVIVLCVLFGAVLVGHGLPFWLAATIFLTVTILLLQTPPAGEMRFTVRRVIVAVVIGLAAGGAVALLFQQIFLVRLP